mmetsp:Transcript_13296/g.31070  ORF Transcript_13296/g.31070 Transcript_13296/m.31070 type:complete len:253 (+) Transcript_13296:3-761(+)
MEGGKGPKAAGHARMGGGLQPAPRELDHFDERHEHDQSVCPRLGVQPAHRRLERRQRPKDAGPVSRCYRIQPATLGLERGQRHGHDQHVLGCIGLQPAHWQLERIEGEVDAGHVPFYICVQPAPLGLGRGPRHKGDQHVCASNCLQPAPRQLVRVEHPETAGHVQRGEQLFPVPRKLGVLAPEQRQDDQHVSADGLRERNPDSRQAKCQQLVSFLRLRLSRDEVQAKLSSACPGRPRFQDEVLHAVFKSEVN